MNEYKILIIDDNRDLADCMTILLEQAGYSPTVVYSGEDAVARVLAGHFDLAIIDLKLPGMNGGEVFYAIRQLRPAMAGILITAYRPDGRLQDMVQQGFIGVLRKPFTMDALLTRIADLRSGKSEPLLALSA